MVDRWDHRIITGETRRAVILWFMGGNTAEHTLCGKVTQAVEVEYPFYLFNGEPVGNKGLLLGEIDAEVAGEPVGGQLILM